MSANASLSFETVDQSSAHMLDFSILSIKLTMHDAFLKLLCESNSFMLEFLKNSSLILLEYMSRLVGKPTMWFPNRSDTNRPVQAQKRARSLKFRI